MPKNYYITTALPYVNARPHLGFALEVIQADVLARWRRQQQDTVFFNTGVDEHGLKIYQKAIELGKTPQQYCDEAAVPFYQLQEKLNLSIDNFIRTTEPRHIAAAQEFWRRCARNGDIYKKVYKAKYCIGCEMEITDSWLVNGRCPLHPSKDVEIIEEENYFFRFSKYQKPLLDFYAANPEFVIPAGRFHEIKNFVASGLQDFSISRQKVKMPWGIPVPGDESQVMYVWFDALINYISCLGWPNNETKFVQFWGTQNNRGAVQIAGKDNLRQQAAMWQAMLLSANLPNSKQIFIHGFITANGQKMSKSQGNVIDPLVLADCYGADALRYFLLRELPPDEDGDFSYSRFENRYNSDLAKGIGNLICRIITLVAKANVYENQECASTQLKQQIQTANVKRDQYLGQYKFNEALAAIWELVGSCDKYIEQTQPWKTNNQDILANLLFALRQIAQLIEPFLPATAPKISRLLSEKKQNTEILFPQIKPRE